MAGKGDCVSEHLASLAMQDVARGVHFSLARSRVLNWELTTGGWKESGTAAGRTPQRTLTGIMDSIKKPTHELLGIFHP